MDSPTSSLSLNNDNTFEDPTWSGVPCDDWLRVLHQDRAAQTLFVFLALRKPRGAARTGRGIRRPGKQVADRRDGRSQGGCLCGASEGRDGTVRRAHPIGDGHAELIGFAMALSLSEDSTPQRRERRTRSHSGYGTSTSRKSSATRTFAKTAFASWRMGVGSSYRGLRCVRMRRLTPASFASSAACREDECPYRFAFSSRAASDVASWMSTSAWRAISSSVSWGIVSPVYTILRPRRGGPSTSSGWTVRPPIVTGSPARSRLYRC